MESGFNHSSPPDNRLNGLSVTKKKNCWCDIRKFMGPPGDVRLNDVHCVCHHRAFSWGSRGCPSPKATLSLMSQRRNNNRLPGGCDSQRFYVPNVLIVWTAYLSITVDFSLSAFFIFFPPPFSYFPYSLLRRLSLFICRFRTLENVNDMQQPAWRLPKLWHYATLNWEISQI